MFTLWKQKMPGLTLRKRVYHDIYILVIDVHQGQHMVDLSYVFNLLRVLNECSHSAYVINDVHKNVDQGGCGC